MSEQQKKLLLSLEDQKKLTEELNSTLLETKKKLEELHNLLRSNGSG